MVGFNLWRRPPSSVGWLKKLNTYQRIITAIIQKYYAILYLFIHHKAVATNFANCWAQAWRCEAAGTLHNSPILHWYLGGVGNTVQQGMRI